MAERYAGEPLIKSEKKTFSSILSSVLLYLFIFLLLIIFLFFFLFSLTPVDGTSMENTIADKSNCFVLRRGYSVSRGDIVTINTSTDKNNEHIIIKRVIATSGDRVLFMVNSTRTGVDLYLCKKGENHFTKQNEPYIKEQMNYENKDYVLTDYIENIELLDIFDTAADEYTAKLLEDINEHCTAVPKNSIYYLGDNRNISLDSRANGCAKLSMLTGKMIKILEPNSAAEKFLSFIFRVDTSENLITA